MNDKRDTRKTVGVLGGMGPYATVGFMTKVIALTPAGKQQDHIHMLVDHNPAVPDRQAAILAEGSDPSAELAAMATRLESAGADFLVIPCNTAHAFKDAVTGAAGIPLISIIDITVSAAIELGAKAVGVLATNGCLWAGDYQRALDKVGVESVLPSDDELGKLKELLQRIDAGDQGESVVRDMRALALALVARGGQAIIAGCTELPLVLSDSMLDVPLLSSTDILAKHTVALARGEMPLPD